MGIIHLVLALLKAFFASRAALAAENLALRQQLVVLQRSVKRAKLRKRERIFWVWLSRLWSAWRSALLIAQPKTVVRWHRQRFNADFRGLSWVLRSLWSQRFAGGKSRGLGGFWLLWGHPPTHGLGANNMVIHQVPPEGCGKPTALGGGLTTE